MWTAIQKKMCRATTRRKAGKKRAVQQRRLKVGALLTQSVLNTGATCVEQSLFVNCEGLEHALVRFTATYLFACSPDWRTCTRSLGSTARYRRCRRSVRDWNALSLFLCFHHSCSQQPPFASHILPRHRLPQTSKWGKGRAHAASIRNCAGGERTYRAVCRGREPLGACLGLLLLLMGCREGSVNFAPLREFMGR